ncbi:dr1-associated corepressor homolog [Pollicipes pollicipes]|uniref:dr1-associated corepressor homolog n=1 Tax=Pollicipes pollicipes TaxID=41117 RepID=UPI001884AD7C|nr:dr1-associated corepressor homolog [Pollicipes pollicipes]
MVSARTLCVLVLVAMVVVSEAAPQFGRGRRFNNRRFRPNRRFQRPNRFNNFVRPNRFLNFNGFNNNGFNNGGSSNAQANANVLQGTQGNSQITQVSANVQTQQQNNPNGVSLVGGVALASNLQLNSPFGNINLSNANAQTINQGQNLGGFFRRG